MCDEDVIKKNECSTHYKFVKEIVIYCLNSKYCEEKNKINTQWLAFFTALPSAVSLSCKRKRAPTPVLLPQKEFSKQKKHGCITNKSLELDGKY